MTDKEIIKALECCKKDDCDNCPNDFGNCCTNLAECSLDLINRKQAEIERLKKILAEEEEKYKLCAKRFYKVGIKDFAERLKESKKKYEGTLAGWTFTMTELDNLVKEMAGDTE